MKLPSDIRSPFTWFIDENVAYAVSNPGGHEYTCKVYWGSHGCDRPQGHEGDHWCDCCECEDHPDPDSGCVAGPPYYGPDTNFYGEGTEEDDN